MSERLNVLKTYKLYINGAFPRTESGRSLPVADAKGTVIAYVCHGSRKDLRDAIEAARKAQAGWAARTHFNRGQILYRMGEMLEGKREEFVEALRATGDLTPAGARKEIDAAIDRLVCFAGWTDKYAQVLGCNNPVAGPYYNFTIPEPTGVVGVVTPPAPALLSLVTLLAPPLAAGNTVVLVAATEQTLPALLLGEVCATSDMPAGAVNIVTGERSELLEHLAMHRNVDAIFAANLPKKAATSLRLGAVDNVKRVRVERLGADDWYDAERCESPWTIEPFVEMKTIWHPASV
jgi:aldehyde dehydrogenase (NAD+)